MKKIIKIFFVLMISLNIFNNDPKASNLNKNDLEKVTISLLHPTIVTAIKDHYGHFTQFQNIKVIKGVPKQLPSALDNDSSFKASGWAYVITLQFETLVENSNIETVTMVLSNEFSGGIYKVKSFDTMN